MSALCVRNKPALLYDPENLRKVKKLNIGNEVHETKRIINTERFFLSLLYFYLHGFSQLVLGTAIDEVICRKNRETLQHIKEKGIDEEI